VLTALALISWTMASPFAAGLALGRSARARQAIGRWYAPALVVGWCGLLSMAAGVMLLHGAPAALAVLVGGPVAGLSLWSRRTEDDEGEDDDGGGGSGPPPDERPPGDGDGTDWDAFERAFRDYAARRPAGALH
jgi:hypothetical protein